ncbi:MAG: alpha/beta hydrolase [Patescibacteria group bacterium]
MNRAFFLRVAVVTMFFVLPSLFVLAQDGRIAAPRAVSTNAESATATAAPPQAESATNTAPSVVTPPATAPPPEGAVVRPRPQPVKPATPAPPPTPPPVAKPAIEPSISNERKNNNALFWPGAAALAGLMAGFGIAQSLKSRKTKDREGEKDKARCFDIKKRMEEKLRELTDLRGQIEGKIKEQTRQTLRDAAQGTHAEKPLTLIEETESAYKTLKKLYEKCVIETSATSNENANCIIIHGCPSDVEKAMDPKTRTYDKHWIPWLKKNLIAAGIKTETPLMPDPWQPNYQQFKAEFEKCEVGQNSILVGHSCGAAFLVRWLGETKRKISKLILVAPWKIPDTDDEFRKEFYTYPIDESIKSRVGEIILFTADDEEGRGKESLKIFHQALGGEIIELKGHGHYTLDDMGTEEFPALLEKIIRFNKPDMH